MQRPPSPAAALETALQIKPHSMESRIFYLGQSKNYKAIAQIINEIDTLHGLQDVLNFQYALAIYIASRISFDISDTPEYSEQATQNIAPSVLKKRMSLKWLHILLTQKMFLERSRFVDAETFIEFMQAPLNTLQGFIEDIGYTYMVFPINTIKDVKRALIQNARLLFEPFLIIKDASPVINVQELRKARKMN